MTNKEIFIEYNDDINNNVFVNPAFLKAEAFGGMRKSLLSKGNIIVQDSFFSKNVLAYAGAIDKGSGAIKNRTGGLWQEIFDWLILKKYSLKWSNLKERKQITFAIVRNRYKKQKGQAAGSYKFRNKSAQTDIFQDAVDKATPKMLKNLVTQKEISTRSNIVDAYKK